MFSSAEFWVGVAFVVFLGILYYYRVPGSVLNSLDNRSKRIADELAEARRLREDAERLLKEFEAKRAAAEREAEDIVTSAREEAERLARETQERLADFVKRRTAAAEAKIAQAEVQASAEVRAAAIDAAIRASEGVLRGEVSGPAAEQLIKRSLGDVKSKLQ
jgi:F-type H+-transporting ATPase subunit b